MILDTEIEIKVNPAQIKHFKSIGLDVRPYDIIKIHPTQLNSGSNIKINCKCDVCGNIKKHPYRRYLRSINNGGFYACSVDCCKNKTKKTFIERYGVEHHFQTESTKNKIKSTWLNKYGTEHFSHSEEYVNKKEKIVNKRKNTIYGKYIHQENIISMDDENIVKYCDKHGGEYVIDKKLYHNRKRFINNICTICNPINENQSLKELDIYDFIKKNTNTDIIQSYRQEGKEIDIYLPELKLGFEFNGLHWHSEFFKYKDYHIDKTEYFTNKGIHLIHIWEDDWDIRRDIVKSRISNLLNSVPNKIYGRNCTIKELNPEIYKKFLNENHIQGNVNSSVKLGLYHKEELVSVMGFGSLRKVLGSKSKLGYWEMLRFCSKLNTSVIGGASKLFKHFLDKYKPISVVSYADRSWSIGGLYEILGFTLKSKTKPNYYYLIKKNRINRYNFRKDVLVKEGYDPNKTEHQIMLNRGIYRIYDCGSLVYEYFY